MQLLEQKPLMANIGMNLNIPKVVSTHAFDVKEKRSSDESLRPMNPVASGDNFVSDLNVNLMHKEDLPMLVPCCEGKELQINQELARSGLSAISMKHESVVQCLNTSTSDKTVLVPGLVKHRNSFRCLHRPDLKRVSYLRRMTPDELEMLFRGYADLSALGAVAAENYANSKMAVPDLENSRPEGTPFCGSNQDNDSTLASYDAHSSGAEEIPVGMRLHGARARLYTSILTGAKTGDQLDTASSAEEYDNSITDTVIPDGEDQLNEELQIILPPRCDEKAASDTTTTTENSNY